MRRIDKHITYYEVLDAVRESGVCPLCRLEAKCVHHYLESLLYERVNDPNVRAELVRARGYCRRHAHLLAGMGNAFGISILYQDQARLFAEFLDNLPGRPSRSLKQSREWQRVECCPACRTQSECRERYASTLVAGLGEEEMRSAYSLGSGLCVPHFLYVLGETKEVETYQFLIAAERSKVDALLRELGEFCRKHDYRFSREGFREEADSWLRAIKLIVGEANTKGDD